MENGADSNKDFIWGQLGLEIFVAVILIYSIRKLKRIIKQLDHSNFLVNERLMMFHTGLYLSFIAFMSFQMFFEIRRYNTYYDQEYKVSCRS